MTVEQKLLNFDKTQENIPRQITSAYCTRAIYPETRKNYIADKVSNGDYEMLTATAQNEFEIEGVRGYIKNDMDALTVAATLARYRYSVANGYMFDLGAGLHSMMTQNKTGLYECMEIGTRDKEGYFTPTGARIICSIDTLKKAMFGPLVDHNGRGLHGTGDIIKDAWRRVQPILDGLAPMPRAFASIHKNVHKQHEEGKNKGKFILDKNGNKILDHVAEALVEGEPISVYRKMTGTKDAVVIDLDYFFFPSVFKNGQARMKGQYIHQVAGLTAFLQLGAREINSRIGNSAKAIDVQTARKIILTTQAAYELRTFAPDIVKENHSHRINISLRRNAVKDLYPSAVDNTGWIRYKDFSNAVAMSGLYYNEAINFTGIKDELIKQNEVVLLATEGGAEFPKDLPNVVYIKADKVKLQKEHTMEDNIRNIIHNDKVKKLAKE